MPEALKESEVRKEQDPSVAKQWDNETSLEEKFNDFAAIADKLWGSSMLGTVRPGIGPVCRCMAVAKRTGPDFLFISNGNSKKFEDLEKAKTVTLSFMNNSSSDWISITGEAVTTSGDDPRLKEVYSKQVSAWFGDLGDGVHTGGPEDPRMKLIEVQATYISYWKASGGGLGLMAEATAAMVMGKVAKAGSLREINGDEIKELRSKHGSMSSFHPGGDVSLE